VVGNFDKAVARKRIEATFGAWPAGRQDPLVPPVREPGSGPARVGVIDKDRQQTLVTIAYPAQAGHDGQYAARLVLTEMLNQQMWGIRTELGSTYGTYAGQSDHVGPTPTRWAGGSTPPAPASRCARWRDKIDSLRRGDDLERKVALARRLVLRRLIAESTNTVAMAGRLATIAVFGLGPDYYDSLVKHVAAVSPAQVKALIAEELVPEHEVVVCMADRPTLERAFQEAGIPGVAYDEPK